MSGPVCGIDIGARGALALLDPAGGLLDVLDMPTLADGPKGRPAVNGVLLADLVRRWAPAVAYIEYVGSRPGEGPTGAFAFGRSRGVVEGVAGAIGLPTRFLTPPVWKRAVGLAPGKDRAKDAARSQALRRWPAHAARFARAKDDGRADACLIGLAGLLRGDA